MSPAGNPFTLFTPVAATPDVGVTPDWGTAATGVARQAETIAIGSPQVIMLRLLMMATHPGEARTQRESMQMITEKVDALQESAEQFGRVTMTLATSWPRLWTDPRAADRMLHQAMTGAGRALTPFSRRVTSNARRLAG